MRVTTFSRQFPGYHPRKGEPTYFVEKILNQRIGSHWKTPMYLQELADLNPDKSFSLIEDFYNSLDFSISDIKPHTIRAGNRWKQGEFFSPRVWSGRPYFSPQIIFAPPVVIKKTWDFEIKDEIFLINNVWDYRRDEIEKLAANDGLSLSDFLSWFRYPAPFDGQVICWGENVNY